MKLGQKLLPLRRYGRSKFSYEIPLLLIKYARRWESFSLKKTIFFKKQFFGKDTFFGTISDPPTPQFAVLSPVQSSGTALSSILPAAVSLEIVLP